MQSWTEDTAAVILLQQAIALGFTHSEQVARQRQVMEASDIDPAALFYTENPLALAAEKEVRHRIQNGR